MTGKKKKTAAAQAKKPKASVRGTGRKKATSKANAVANHGIKKQYLKSRDSCKVTFRLPGPAVQDAGVVCVVGEFNGWDAQASPMKKLKSGDFTTTLELAPGREYRFRYLIDQSIWENDWNADKYEKGPYGNDDSVIIL
ncbi:MAG: isoamylase early set domain-containing protein [Deltaproteobacteria bacterium]|nr:isoamylase early set domain-containing protein [Deltaproteobacteria bacterium]